MDTFFNILNFNDDIMSFSVFKWWRVREYNINMKKDFKVFHSNWNEALWEFTNAMKIKLASYYMYLDWLTMKDEWILKINNWQLSGEF